MTQIPSLADLALKYGTITLDHFNALKQLHHQRKDSGNPIGYDLLLLGQKLATEYQVGLLKLIREYLIVKKSGEVFGKIAIENGYATREDVDAALEIQQKEFKRAKLKKLIGDILVEDGVITEKQKKEILAQQQFAATHAEKIISKATEPNDAENQRQESQGVDLSIYQKQFLKVKALDKEFAAVILEKKMTTGRKIKVAERIQEEEFEKRSEIRLVGDILVDLSFITEDQKNQILVEQKRIKTDPGKASGRAFSISISPDKMEAWVEVKKDPGPVRLVDIKAAITEKGITHGIFPDAILQGNLDMDNRTFLCAKQDFSVELVKQKKTKYHFQPFPIGTQEIRKGGALAELAGLGDIAMGIDLFGETKEIQTNPSFRCGSGVRLSMDKTKAFAGKTGFPGLSVEGKLFVHPWVSVLENADMKYGPLEPFANLSVTGVLEGAYPVSAGHIQAREIRGATITAFGNIDCDVGITDSTIISQGDVNARYLHNCRIETCGNLRIKNEIIDSEIYCGGKIESSSCHIIASTLFGKKGVEILSAGNEKTKPCVIGSGTEHQVLERIRKIDVDIQDIRKELDELLEKKEEQKKFSTKTFQKMIELKIFHDRAKTKKEKLSEEFKKTRDTLSKEKLNNIAKLIHTYERRKTASLSSLKKFNEIKKKYDKETNLFEKKIKRLKPKIKNETADLKMDITAFLEWAKRQENICQIKINKDIYPGTFLKGVYSSVTIKENKTGCIAFEKQTSEDYFEMTIQEIPIS